MTLYLRPTAGLDEGALRESFARRYADSTFVRVLPEGQWPHTKWAAGTNYCFIAVATDQASGRLVVVSVLDNLGKGMAGQMVQCLNLMLGIDEATGLKMPASYP